MPNSSSSAAKVPGTGSPSMARWARVRDWSRSRGRRRRCPRATMRRHRLDVLGRGRLVAGAPLAHHVGPHGAVGHLGADVDGLGQAVDARRGTRGRSPTPHWMPADRAAPGMSSTPSIRPMSHSCAVGRARGEADAAVAHHDGGDAVPARRRQQRVPRDLAVVVGVDVDEAGRHEGAVGVDRPRAPRRRPARPR